VNRLRTCFVSNRVQELALAERNFFQDDKGVLYRHRLKGEPQMIVPVTLVHEVIMLNHDPVYVVHPGTKWTHDLIELQYWWPGMRKAI